MLMHNKGSFITGTDARVWETVITVDFVTVIHPFGNAIS